MSNLRIVNQSLAWRCDICHQVDCYDAALDHCSRCAEIKAQIISQTALPARDPFEILTAIGGFGGGLICGLWLFVGYFQTGKNLQLTHFIGMLISLLFSISIGALSGLLLAGTLNLCGYLGRSLLAPLKRLRRRV